MIIFISNVQRMLRKKWNLIPMLVFPAALILLVMWLNMEGTRILRVGVVDHDATPLTQNLMDVLQEKAHVQKIRDTDIQVKLTEDLFDYVIVIDRGFTGKLIKNENPMIKGYRIQEANTSAPVRIGIESFINAARNIAKVSEGDSDKFYRGMKDYQNGSFAMAYQTIEDGTRRKRNTVFVMGFLVLGMLFFSSIAATLVLEDKQNNTFYRLFYSPLSLKSYMFQHILSLLLLSLLQIGAIFAIMLLVFKADFGPSVFNIFAVFAVFSLVSVSFGLAISSASKNKRQASVVSSLLVTPICMLGGCFWPREIMPDILIKIADFVPTTWILKTVEKIVFGSSLAGVAMEILILFLFALIFFLVGTWRRVDLEKL